jgi:hypothetical protein
MSIAKLVGAFADDVTRLVSVYQREHDKLPDIDQKIAATFINTASRILEEIELSARQLVRDAEEWSEGYEPHSLDGIEYDELDFDSDVSDWE